MTTLLLVRHGQASFGQDNYDQLSALGARQAQLLGRQYGSARRRIDAIYTGSLIRQQQSAQHFWQAYRDTASDHDEPLSRHLFDEQHPEDSVIAEFDEFNHKDVMIKSNPAFKDPAHIAKDIAKAPVPNERLAQLFDLAMQRWHAGNHDDDYIESWTQFQARALKALTRLCDEVSRREDLGGDSTALVFTSGGVIAAISANLLGQHTDFAYMLNKRLINTGVTVISFANTQINIEGARLLSLNEHSHLYDQAERLITWR